MIGLVILGFMYLAYRLNKKILNNSKSSKLNDIRDIISNQSSDNTDGEDLE